MNYPFPYAKNSLAARKRRVFFSFHYGADIWRANQVRNSWRYQKEDQREAFGWFDASIWESSRRSGDESLKTLIRGGLANTSVTCVLAGTLTFSRRWVRYEIAQSVVRGNGLLSVKINGLKDQYSRPGLDGPNPLDYMGVYRVPDGRILLAEKDQRGNWVAYGDYTREVNLPYGWEQPTGTIVITLSRYSRVYDYCFDGGFRGLGDWVTVAAMEAGR